jgi:hypothetical protein
LLFSYQKKERKDQENFKIQQAKKTEKKHKLLQRKEKKKKNENEAQTSQCRSFT